MLSLYSAPGIRKLNHLRNALFMMEEKWEVFHFKEAAVSANTEFELFLYLLL